MQSRLCGDQPELATGYWLYEAFVASGKFCTLMLQQCGALMVPRPFQLLRTREYGARGLPPCCAQPKFREPTMATCGQLAAPHHLASVSGSGPNSQYGAGR